MYEKRMRLRGVKLSTVPLNKDLSLNTTKVLEKATPNTRLIFICSPNNPTGNEFEPDKISTLAEETSALIVVDEAYAEFGDYSASSLAAEKLNVMVIRTFSKAFGLAGIRLGYAIAHPEMASFISGVIPYTIGTVTANFALKILRRIDLVTDAVEAVKRERRRLLDALRQIKKIEVFDSKTNFITFRPRVNADDLHKELLKKGIIVKNLKQSPVIGHCLRVTIGLPDMNNRFISALKEILENDMR